MCLVVSKFAVYINLMRIGRQDAIRYERDKVSVLELQSWCAHLMKTLMSKKLPETLAVIWIDRGIPLVVAVLSCLLAGTSACAISRRSV